MWVLSSDCRYLSKQPRGRRRQARGGYLYIAVVFTTLIVGAIAMTGLSLQADNLAAHRAGGDWMQARELADSAIALAVARIKSTSSWRTTYAHGAVTTPVSLGTGSIAFSLHDDSDSSLSDSALERIRIRGIGTVGSARYVRSVEMDPSGPGIACLNHTVCVNNAFSPSTAVEWSTDGTFAFNGLFNTYTSGSTVTADVYYRYFRFAYRTCGTTQSMSSSIPMPPSTFSQYYEQQGTAISITSLPSSGGYRNLENVAIGPGRNPYGSTNALGIYIIDCNGTPLRIRNCRIRGTLLIKNPGASSGVYDAVDWTPGTGNLPALLVQGDFALRTTEGVLSEASQATNFNPSGMTSSDSDTSDSYPSAIRGLVYVTETATVGPSTGSRMVFHGCLVCGDLFVTGDLMAYQIPGMRSNAPPGFRDGSSMQIVQDSWRREY